MRRMQNAGPGRRAVVGGLSAVASTAVIVAGLAVPAFAADGDPSPSPTPTATDALSPSPEPSTPAPEGTPAPTATAVPVPVPRLDARTLTQQTVTSRTVVLRGSGLDDIASISMGTSSLGAPKHLSGTRIAVRIGGAPAFSPDSFALVLHRRSNAATVRTGVRITYVATTFRARELRWAWANLRNRVYAWGHPYIYKYDCANFTSHALVTAGMSSTVLDVSSTSLRRKLLASGAKELADTQRDRAAVRIGDVVQFDWHPTKRNPGDRDHTGIVTDVQRDASGRIVIRYSAHTDGGNNPSLQLQIEHTMNRPHHDPHGKVYFLHLPV